jgi:cytochrome b involved in lipid metabolism
MRCLPTAARMPDSKQDTQRTDPQRARESDAPEDDRTRSARAPAEQVLHGFERVPIHRGDLGPSGTSSPLFNALDAFFGRTRFDSFLGREIVLLRASYPPAWRAFVAALEQTSIARHVERSASSALRDTWHDGLEAYAGERGFLGRHRRKVYGYLETAFKVGRSLTIGGFSGTFNDRTWDRVDDALEQARVERLATSPARAEDPLTEPGRVDADTAYDLSEIARHNRADPGYWLILDGRVYDVTRFCARHPGGAHVLRTYAGLDASTGFARAHPSRAAHGAHGEIDAHGVHGAIDAHGAIDVLRAGLRIGVVRRLALGAAESEVHEAFARALWLAVEMQNVFESDQGFRLESDAPQVVRSRYELQRSLDTHLRFAHECLSVLLDRTLPELWCAARGDAALWRRLLEPLRGSDAARRVTREAFEQLEAWLREPSRSAQLERLAAADRRCLDKLKRCLVAAVQTFERQDGRSNGLDWRALRRACLACAAVIRRYYQRADSALSDLQEPA